MSQQHDPSPDTLSTTAAAAASTARSRAVGAQGRPTAPTAATAATATPGADTVRAMVTPSPRLSGADGEHFVRVVLSGLGLHVRLQSLDDGTGDAALVVAPQGDARRAGLTSGMILRAINGRRTRDLPFNEARELLAAVSAKRSLNPAAVELQLTGGPVGLSLAEEEPGFGVRIAAVLSDSVAAETGQLEAGDVITHINSTPTTEMRTSQVSAMLKRLNMRRERATLGIRRDTATFFVVVPPDLLSVASDAESSSGTAHWRGKGASGRQRLSSTRDIERAEGARVVI